MNGNRIIVIGASAGGVEALKQLVKLLPADFPAPILVVLHIPAQGVSVLPAILTRAGKLQAIHPCDRQPIEKSHIYIAPPDKHLLVKRGHLSLSLGPRENGHRPAVDPLFRTAARSYGRNVIGVILSGALDDGTAGLAVIKELGGTTVAQVPEDAIYPGMPQSAIDHVDVDYVLPIAEIASLLVHLANEPIQEHSKPAADNEVEYETDITELDMTAVEHETPSGKISTFVCPECGGTLWEITEGDVLRYRCHVGHAYTAETFSLEQAASVERALWIALRALEDSATLAHRMTTQARSHNRQRAAQKYEEQAQNVEEHAKIIRDVLLKGVLGEGIAESTTEEENPQT